MQKTIEKDSLTLNEESIQMARETMQVLSTQQGVSFKNILQTFDTATKRVSTAVGAAIGRYQLHGRTCKAYCKVSLGTFFILYK